MPACRGRKRKETHPIKKAQKVKEVTLTVEKLEFSYHCRARALDILPIGYDNLPVLKTDLEEKLFSFLAPIQKLHVAANSCEDCG